MKTRQKIFTKLWLRCTTGPWEQSENGSHEWEQTVNGSQELKQRENFSGEWQQSENGSPEWEQYEGRKWQIQALVSM